MEVAAPCHYLRTQELPQLHEVNHVVCSYVRFLIKKVAKNIKFFHITQVTLPLSKPRSHIRTPFYIMALMAAVGFLSLVVKLYHLQIKRGEELAFKSEQNYVHPMRLLADRGVFYDAQKRVLVDNRPALDLYATPYFITQFDETINALARFLELTPEEKNTLALRLQNAKKTDRYQPVLIRRDLNKDQLELIESERMIGRMQGLHVVDSGVRTYLYGDLLGHVVGYLNEIGPHELEQKKQNADTAYQVGDFVGRRGLEKTFESYLRGIDGFEAIVVDSKGRRQNDAVAEEFLGEDRQKPSTPGNHLILSLDLDIQRSIAQHFSGDAGVVIAVEVDTGFIVGFYSKPSYDPNLVSGRMLLKEKQRLDADPLKPWINRGIQEHYAPGSTYKVFSALTALEKKVITEDSPYSCSGHYKLGNNTWRCFKESGHGLISLHRSLVVSCDTYYYAIGAKLGIESLAGTAREFGFGQRTGIALDQEIPGIVPDEAFHDLMQKKEGGYKPGFAVNTAVGQGANAFTPLQLVMAYAAIANGGTLYKPQLVKRIEDVNHQLVQEFKPEVVRQIHFNTHDMDAVRLGLCGVVNEIGGTAYSQRHTDLKVCGKTGTAQVARLKKRVKDQRVLDYKVRDNAWFVGYAPMDNPKLAVVAITEHGGFGGMASAPVVVSVLRAYLLGEYPNKEETPYFRIDESPRLDKTFSSKKE